MENLGPNIRKSALVVVDMQNDFLHPEGAFAIRARENPDRIDMAFLSGTIPYVKKLLDGFRQAGRPVIYVAHLLKPDYSDAQFPYWRTPARADGRANRTFMVENTWGSAIVDELKPRDGEHLLAKKGFGGFSNTPLDTILRNLGIDTCVVCGVTTCVCVSTTVRGGVELNYRMILVKDAVAEVSRDVHDHELKTMQRIFADVKSTDEVLEMLHGAMAPAS
jgi:ureidoacrylate peracid hydrolase